MKIAICAIAKKENDYIGDWVKYHIDLGFDKIYLYDNNDSTFEDVAIRIPEDYRAFVEIIRINDMFADQVIRYTEFYNQYKDEYDWILFTDIDEFTTLSKYDNLKAFLGDEKFTNTEVIKLALKDYGDGGILEGDISVPIYERILKPSTVAKATSTKGFVKGGLKGVAFNSAHFPTRDGNLLSQKLANGEESKNKICIDSFVDDVYIRHYMSKTLSEYINQKLGRTDVRFSNKNFTQNFDYFFKVNEKTEDRLVYIKSKGFTI